MINRFHDIVHIHGLISQTDGVCLKDMTRLLMREPAAFYMIRIICQINLRAVIDAPSEPHFLLFQQDAQQRGATGILPAFDRQPGIRGNVLGLTRQKGPRNFPC